jgi:hypothetical protein
MLKTAFVNFVWELEVLMAVGIKKFPSSGMEGHVV